MRAGCPWSGLGHLSLAASLPGLLLVPTPQGPPGMGEKGSPRLYESQEMLQNRVLRGLCGAQLQASQAAHGARGQGSARGLLSLRGYQARGMMTVSDLRVLPRETESRPESWRLSRRLQAYWRPREIKLLVLGFSGLCHR